MQHGMYNELGPDQFYMLCPMEMDTLNYLLGIICIKHTHYAATYYC